MCAIPNTPETNIINKILAIAVPIKFLVLLCSAEIIKAFTYPIKNPIKMFELIKFNWVDNPKGIEVINSFPFRLLNKVLFCQYQIE